MCSSKLLPLFVRVFYHFWHVFCSNQTVHTIFPKARRGEGAEGRGEGASHAEDALVTTAASWCCECIECEMPENWIPLVVDFSPQQWIKVSWDTLFTEVALKLVAFIGVVKGVVSTKLAHVLAMLAATLACEYLVRVAAFVVVEKLHYNRLGRCNQLWVLLPILFKPAHLVVRVEDEGGSVRSGVVAEFGVRDAEKKGALSTEYSTSQRHPGPTDNYPVIEMKEYGRCLNRLRDIWP